MLLRQNEIVMPLLIVIDTHHRHLTATTVEWPVVVVVIVTAIQESMIQGETTNQVVTTVRGMGIQHQATAVLVVDQWKKIRTDPEPRWEVELVVVTVGLVATAQVKMSKEVSVTQLAIQRGCQQIKAHPTVTID